MKPGIIEGMNRIKELSVQIQKRDQEREDEQLELSKKSDYTYEDEPPRYEREKPLKRNKVYSETELAIYFDNKDR